MKKPHILYFVLGNGDRIRINVKDNQVRMKKAMKKVQKVMKITNYSFCATPSLLGMKKPGDTCIIKLK